MVVIDTGASVSLVEPKHVDMSKVDKCRLKQVTGISGKPLRILGKVRVSLVVDPQMCVNYDAYVAEELKFGCILGADQLRAGKAQIDLEFETLRFHGKWLNMNKEAVCLGVTTETSESDDPRQQRREAFLSCCGPALTEKDREEVVSMMEENASVFSWNGEIRKVRSPLCKLEMIEGLNRWLRNHTVTVTLSIRR